jgi:hypothetical protein
MEKDIQIGETFTMISSVEIDGTFTTIGDGIEMKKGLYSSKELKKWVLL